MLRAVTSSRNGTASAERSTTAGGEAASTRRRPVA